ncbi:MAG: aminoglycoside phosphotransferase family protein [Nannocystaceae bacterium]|nr:aminoglycoside phosphotransferase family protein [Nannocystaceae bacterium]
MRDGVSIEEGAAVLEDFGFSDALVEPLGSGLINDTFSVREGGRDWVLQRVHTVFSPLIHHNIAAVTDHLASKGVATPQLRPTRDGALWSERSGRAWRVMTRMPGVTFDAVRSTGQACAAAAALGRFHRALEDLEYTFVGLRCGVHDTPAHLQHLRDAVAEHTGHRLYDVVAPLAEVVLRSAELLPMLDDLPSRIAHGDPKLNNVMFAGPTGEASEEALGLIDLDTVAPMPLHLELGDAWRSWCNPKGEDEAHAVFDLDVFEASVRGYTEAGPTLAAQERAALTYGVEVISLELSTRFLADALNESYFGWNRHRYASAGEHNLVRARGQWSLHQAAIRTRADRARMLGA